MATQRTGTAAHQHQVLSLNKATADAGDGTYAYPIKGHSRSKSHSLSLQKPIEEQPKIQSSAKNTIVSCPAMHPRARQTGLHLPPSLLLLLHAAQAGVYLH